MDLWVQGGGSMVGLLTALLAIGTASGAGGYDHNHPDVAWNTLETDHFTFTGPSPRWMRMTCTGSRRPSPRANSPAEDAYPKICGQFNHFLKEETHVVVYDQDNGWEGNGFVAEYD